MHRIFRWFFTARKNTAKNNNEKKPSDYFHLFKILCRLLITFFQIEAKMRRNKRLSIKLKKKQLFCLKILFGRQTILKRKSLFNNHKSTPKVMSNFRGAFMIVKKRFSFEDRLSTKKKISF